MESAMTVEMTALAAAVGFVGLAMLLGALGQRWLGALLLGSGAAIAAAISLGAALAGYNAAGRTGGWLGLLTGMGLAGMLVPPLLGTVIKGRRGRFITGSWFGFCALSIYGYLAGGWLGLLTLTLPAILLFWVVLYRLSLDLLPLRDKKNRIERRKAFRSLVTFTLGTNFPYYFVDEDSRPLKRVDGNPFGKILAGPGFVITNCDQAAYVTDGVFVKGVFEPGLTFTGLYDLEPQIIDLRTQLRAFPVEALTKDGIPIEVVTFVPYRIDPGNRAVEPGQPFPFRRAAVYQALANELVERRADKADRASGQKHEWDGGPRNGLVPLLVTPIVQDIISRYTVDELCAPLDPERDPRRDMAGELRSRAEAALRPRGLKVVGGGISNLVPQNEAVNERRLDNWRTEWVGRVLARLSESQAHRMNLLELARAKAAVEIVKLFGQNLKTGVREGLHPAIALGFIDTVGDVVGEGDDQWPLPNETLETTLKKLRGELTEPVARENEAMPRSTRGSQ